MTLALARRGRRRRERTLGRAGGRLTAGAGRVLGVVAILLALAAIVSVATYVFLERYSA